MKRLSLISVYRKFSILMQKKREKRKKIRKEFSVHKFFSCFRLFVFYGKETSLFHILKVLPYLNFPCFLASFFGWKILSLTIWYNVQNTHGIRSYMVASYCYMHSTYSHKLNGIAEKRSYRFAVKMKRWITTLWNKLKYNETSEMKMGFCRQKKTSP